MNVLVNVLVKVMKKVHLCAMVRQVQSWKLARMVRCTRPTTAVSQDVRVALCVLSH